MISLGKQHNGLYFFSIPKQLKSTSSINNVAYYSHLWYQHLRQLSNLPMKFLINSNFSINHDFNKAYDICPLVKQTRLPFGSSYINTK